MKHSTMKWPTIRNAAITKLLVTLFILWINLGFSIGEDLAAEIIDLDDDQYNQTDVDWLWESIVVLRWDIDNQPSVQYSNLRFDIDFTVSDFIQADEHVRYTIYQNSQCGNPNDIITDSDGYMETWVTEDDTPVGIGLDMDTRRTVRISNQLNPENIAKSESYIELPAESEIDAVITYCVRFSLWSSGPSDPSAEEINHISVTVALDLDLTDESLSISGQKIESLEEGAETSGDQFFLECFICDENGIRPTDMIPHLQGEVVRICVQPTQQASEVGFRIKSIDTFSFSQGTTSQAAVLNGEVAANQLTDLWCEQGARQCVIETFLFSHFYQHKRGTILGSGEATLQWGGEGVDRRFLLQFDPGVEFGSVEEKRRFLEDRDSTKTMEVQKFGILADQERRPPLLNKTVARIQRIVLVSLLFLFCVVLILPLAYCLLRRSKQNSSTFEVDLASPEDESYEDEPFDNVDQFAQPGNRESQFIVSNLPDDRTATSMKSSRSDLPRGYTVKLKDDRTVTSMKSSRSNQSLKDDRTIASARSSRSNRSNRSNWSKGSGGWKDERTVASAKSSRSNRSTGSKRAIEGRYKVLMK